ncbi:hypothetical protein LSAT2_004733 [Lamellibrachia satsuma]|nr:hypothetical protein LSAT2_004733 [Lamellibrachia satsuma]
MCEILSKGYDSTKDREKEQNKKIVTFLKKHFQPLAVSYHNEGVGNMAFYYNSPLLFLAGIITQAKVDLWLAFGSLLFVSVVMRVYTCSCWVTFWSLFGMATSFISALLVYYYVFDLHFLGEWHLLSAFVFVGVGVDNVFVCHDAWMDAGRHHHATLAHRLSASCREVASPVFMTTLIITTAYSAKAASPLLTIYSFGVFIAPLTLINSLSVAFLFPVVIVTYHVTWKKLECGEHRVNLKNDSASGLLRQAQLERKEHALANVFGGPYLRCIVHPTARWLILLISVCLIGNSSYIIWRSFRVNRKQLTYFKEDTNFGQFEQKHDMAFSDSLDSDHTSKIYLVWGLLDQDLSSCHATDHLCIGRTVLDNQFEINSKAAQLALLGVCRHLKNLLAADITRLHIRKHFYTRQPELKCFIDDVNKLLQKEQNRLILDAGTGNASRVYPVGTNLSIPVGREEAELIVKNNPKFFPQSMPTGYDRYFEVVVWFWAISMEHSCEYSDLLGIVHNKDYAEHHVHCAYFHQRLAFVAIAINTTLHPSTVRYRPGEEVRAQYEQLMTSFDMPAGTKKGFHLALGADIVSDFNRNMWHWFKVQKFYCAQRLMWFSSPTLEWISLPNLLLVKVVG